MTSEHESPLHVWCTARNMSVQQLTHACSVSDDEIRRIETGEMGIPGEVQDYLTKQGENVSWMASEQSQFISMKKREF